MRRERRKRDACARKMGKRCRGRRRQAGPTKCGATGRNVNRESKKGPARGVWHGQVSAFALPVRWGWAYSCKLIVFKIGKIALLWKVTYVPASQLCQELPRRRRGPGGNRPLGPGPSHPRTTAPPNPFPIRLRSPFVLSLESGALERRLRKTAFQHKALMPQAEAWLQAQERGAWAPLHRRSREPALPLAPGAGVRAARAEQASCEQGRTQVWTGSLREALVP